MATNGNLPASMLMSIPGNNAGLRKDAALAYRAMDLLVNEDMALFDGDIGRAYRNFARQVIARNFWCNLGKCGNAAVPGTSNHGLALSVDLASLAQRQAVDRAGRPFGWAKEWSDAQHEWWHLTYRPGVWKPKPDPLRFLGPKRKQAANNLLFRRRMRAKEAASGKGPQWRKWNRLVGNSYRKVEKLHKRAGKGRQKRVLKLVLEDRNGTLT